MGIFDDHKFNNLDWVSQITETIDSDINQILARMPNEANLDIKAISACMTMNWQNNGELHIGKVIQHVVKNTDYENSWHGLPWEEQNMINSCFELQIDNNTVINFENSTMSGNVRLVKTKHAFDDVELQPLLGLHGMRYINSITLDPEYLPRINEVLELLGECNDEGNSRSIKKKRHLLKTRLSAIFANNEWRIRDATLANKISMWISSYIKTGNLSAFANFCKVKIMTHNNMPIYSIEEEQ